MEKSKDWGLEDDGGVIGCFEFSIPQNWFLLEYLGIYEVFECFKWGAKLYEIANWLHCQKGYQYAEI